MALWNRKKKNWEDEYDEYYAQDRRAEPAKKPGRLRFIPHTLLLGFLGSLYVGAVGLVSGPTMVEKMLTTLASPVGVVWIALIVMVYFCLLTRQAWPAMVGFFCWLMLTIGGNQFCSQWLARSLESRYQDLNVFESEPFDIVVVMGGGTNSTLNGVSQLASSGDRIAMAARLYHAGLARKLICTGTQTFQASPNDLHPREEASEILIGLGVPKDAILQMQGENTSQEMVNLKSWLEKTDAHGRIGILTSAWHLPRTMKLAEKHGLEVLPIPSNFLSARFAPSPSMIVPGAENLMITGNMFKEYLARWVGR